MGLWSFELIPGQGSSNPRVFVQRIRTSGCGHAQRTPPRQNIGMTNNLIALILTTALSTPALAQRLGVSVGHSRMTGRIGNFDSNEGTTLRVGAELNPNSLFRVGFEA